MLALNKTGINREKITKGIDNDTPVSIAKKRPRTAGASAERKIAPGVQQSIIIARVNFPDAVCCSFVILALAELNSLATFGVFPLLDNFSATYNTASSTF